MTTDRKMAAICLRKTICILRKNRPSDAVGLMVVVENSPTQMVLITPAIL